MEMRKVFFAVLCVLCSVRSIAQEDSFAVYPRGNNVYLMYTTQNGETVFMLARRFHVPPAILADANGLTYQSGIANNTLLMVPLGAYNYLKDGPVNMNEARGLYYIVRDGDDMEKISKAIGVSVRQLQVWNKTGRVKAGQKITVGWVLFDATGYKATAKTNNVIESTTKLKQTEQKTVVVDKKKMQKKLIPNKDGSFTVEYVPIDEPKPLDSLYTMSPFGITYIQQTDSNKSLDSEKGATVFFDARTSNAKNMFFAFSNTVERGTIIKVYNSNTQKTILVKVIGAIPDSKQYYNTSIAINMPGKEALHIVDEKAWCEMWFGKGKRKPVPTEKKAEPNK